MMAGPGSHLPALAFDDGGHVLGRDAVEVQVYLARAADRLVLWPWVSGPDVVRWRRAAPRWYAINSPSAGQLLAKDAPRRVDQVLTSRTARAFTHR